MQIEAQELILVSAGRLQKKSVPAGRPRCLIVVLHVVANVQTFGGIEWWRKARVHLLEGEAIQKRFGFRDSFDA